MDIINDNGYLSSKKLDFEEAIKRLIEGKLVPSPKTAKSLAEFVEESSSGFKEGLMRLVRDEVKHKRTSYEPKRVGPMVDHRTLIEEELDGPGGG